MIVDIQELEYYTYFTGHRLKWGRGAASRTCSQAKAKDHSIENPKPLTLMEGGVLLPCNFSFNVNFYLLHATTKMGEGQLYDAIIFYMLI